MQELGTWTTKGARTWGIALIIAPPRPFDEESNNHDPGDETEDGQRKTNDAPDGRLRDDDRDQEEESDKRKNIATGALRRGEIHRLLHDMASI